ncbi:MAG: hypothetical protein ACKO47_05700, partial [Alphaproteobacteria bacterium]
HENRPDFLKTQRIPNPDLPKPDAITGLKALASNPSIEKIKKSLSTESTPDLNQKPPTPNKGNSRSR